MNDDDRKMVVKWTTDEMSKLINWVFLIGCAVGAIAVTVGILLSRSCG